MMVVTTAGDSRDFIIRKLTRPARAEVPSLSSAMPTATPMTNSQCMLSIRAPPALTSRKPTMNAGPSVGAPGTPMTPGARA